MMAPSRVAPWLSEFFERWQRYGTARHEYPVFYGILRDLDPRTLRVPRDQLNVAEGDDTIERSLLKLWSAWNMFLADDWSHAVEKVESLCDKIPNRPEPHIFFAIMQLAQSNRRTGFVGIQRALKADPDNAALQNLLELLGIRRPPVLSFLPRNSPLNIALGKLRHRARGALHLSLRPLL